MPLTDEEFREEYKPLHIPTHYDDADTQQTKIIYALAQLGEGTSNDVIKKLEDLEPGIVADQLVVFVKTVLSDLYNKGKLAGNEKDGVTFYNLHKIQQQNSGSVDPQHKGFDLH